MMRITKLADYGVLILSAMAKEPEKQQTALEIATALDVSLPVASKLLKQLTQGGLLLSSRGAQGGYRLAKAPKLISVAEILAIIEGQLALTDCNEAKGLCDKESTCQAKKHWFKLQRLVKHTLSSLSLADLVEEEEHTYAVDTLAI